MAHDMPHNMPCHDMPPDGSMLKPHHQSTARTPPTAKPNQGDLTASHGSFLTVPSGTGGAVSRAIDAHRHAAVQFSFCFTENGSDAAEWQHVEAASSIDDGTYCNREISAPVLVVPDHYFWN